LRCAAEEELACVGQAGEFVQLFDRVADGGEEIIAFSVTKFPQA